MNTNPTFYARDPRDPLPPLQFVPATSAQFVAGNRVGQPGGHYVCIAPGGTTTAPPIVGGQSNDAWRWSQGAS